MDIHTERPTSYGNNKTLPNVLARNPKGVAWETTVDYVTSPVMVCSALCCAVCSLHMLARQYSILLARQRKLKTRKYFIIASEVNTYMYIHTYMYTQV